MTMLSQCRKYLQEYENFARNHSHEDLRPNDCEYSECYNFRPFKIKVVA